MRTLIIDRILGRWRSSDWIYSKIISIFFLGTAAFCKHYHRDLATILRGSLHYINPRGKGGARWSKLSEDDLELTELLKIEKPSENIFMTLFATSAQISYANS